MSLLFDNRVHDYFHPLFFLTDIVSLFFPFFLYKTKTLTYCTRE